MPVNRSQRTYPLALTADPLNTGIVSAFDWAAEDDSTATSNGKDHSGNNRHFTPPGTAPTIVTTSVGKGRDTSKGRTVAGQFYDATGAITIGMDVGTGDFSIFKRVRTPSTAPATTATRQIGRIADSGGNKIVFALYEVTSTAAWHWQITFDSTSLLLWNSAGNLAIPAGTDTMLHITRVSGVVKCFVNGVLKTTTNGNTTNILSTTGASHTIVGNYTAGQTGVDAVYLDDIYWNRGLSDAEVTAHAANPYSYYANSVAADAIVVTTPAASATVSGASFTVAGTYSGASTVTSVEASFNGGAYATVDAAPSAGTFSGSLTGQTAGTGTLTVRSKNGASVLATTTVTGVVVVTDGIAFTTPDSASLRAVPHRMYQRDGNNQASVRLTGTYTGTPTSIEYRWKAGTWATLVASPTGGVFDQSVTLQGPGQGSIEIRFSNSTGITASMAYIGVGDIWITAGQSQHVGKSPSYTQPISPDANPSWKSVKFAKDGTWKLHEESSTTKYDGETATYTVHQDPTPQGSYFGALATKVMAAGVPVAFVPVAMGSTSLGAWAVNTSTSSLYGAMIAVAAALGSHKGVLWWQGETDAAGSSTQATHENGLNAIVNDWLTRTGKKFYVLNINAAGTGSNFAVIHAAIAAVGTGNGNCGGYADLNGSFTGDIHYDTVGEMEELATRTFAAMSYEISANSAWTEASDQWGVSVDNIVQVNSSWTESSDTSVVSVNVVASGSISWTEAPDTSTITATVEGVISGGVVWEEVSDVSNIVVSLLSYGVINHTDTDDLYSISAVISGVTAGTISWQDSDDIHAISATAQQSLRLDMLWTEVSDVMTVLVSIDRVGAISWAESNDMTSITATLPSVVSLIPASTQVKFQNPRYKITFSKG